MRHVASVTAISWIPSEAITKLSLKMPFEMGVAHYDEPLPDKIDGPDDLELLRQADRFRFANELRAYVDVEDGRITGYGHLGGGHIGATTLRMGSRKLSFQGIPFPDIQPDPTTTATSVTFLQSAGGRTGVPAPRRVSRKPFVQFSAPSAWSTLSLTINSDGTSQFEVIGASPFPRHWIYDAHGALVAKTGLIDFTDWYRNAFAEHSPWGDEESPAIVTAVETALERELSSVLMKGHSPSIRKLSEGDVLTEQGTAGDELYLILDGVIGVEVDGEQLAELGPGAMLGERALLEGGTRTSTLRAVTNCRIAAAKDVDIDRAKLEELSEGHRREDHR